MPDSPSWDPTQYARFADHRNRPFFDLTGRVRASDPAVVVDLGCGNGPLTLSLADRWPKARVVGVDSSAQMLEAARGHDNAGRVEWVQADVRDWEPASLGAAPDVIVTNATLQWVPGHLDLLQGWMAALSPGGWLAMQVPGNFDAPSHRLMREVAARQPRARELTSVLKRADAVAQPETYLRVLRAAGGQVDVWETTYLQVLDPDGAQEDPVLEWVRGTGLRPVLDLMSAEETEAYLAEYRPALHAAYPRTDGGVVFPFRRVFAVAQRS